MIDVQRLSRIHASNWWDGPLSGLADYDGQLCAWSCASESDSGQRVFALYSMTPEQQATAEERRTDFERWVGDHCRLGHDGYRLGGCVADYATHHLFYEKHDSNPDRFDKSRRIGEFTFGRYLAASALARAGEEKQ